MHLSFIHITYTLITIATHRSPNIIRYQSKSNCFLLTLLLGRLEIAGELRIITIALTALFFIREQDFLNNESPLYYLVLSSAKFSFCPFLACAIFCAKLLLPQLSSSLSKSLTGCNVGRNYISKLRIVYKWGKDSGVWVHHLPFSRARSTGHST